MDNIELYSRIRDLDREISALRLTVSDRVSNIWLVMLSGFYVLAFFGLCLVHQVLVDSVHETPREIPAVQSTAPPKTHLRAAP